MDNTTGTQQGQNTPGSAVPQQDVQQAQPAQSAGPDVQSNAPSAGTYSVFPQQPAPSGGQQVGTQQPVPTQETPSQGESPRITLVDLYGPSTPTEAPQQPVLPQAPSQESMQSIDVAQPATSSEQSVSEAMPIPPSTMPPETEPVQPVENVSPVQQEPVQAIPSLAPSGQGTIETTSKGEEKKSASGNNFFPTFMKFAVSGLVLLLIGMLVVGAIYFLLKGQSNTGGGAGGGNVSLVYWGLWEDNSVMAPVLADFHKKYPNITVTYVRQDPKQYVQRLLTRIKNGDGPDIFVLHNTWISPLQSALLPLPTSVISPKDLESNYPPVVKNDSIINGAVYGLPTSLDVLSLFVNDDIFSHAGASVPTTWDNFITVAKALTVKDPNGHIQTAGAALGTYGNIAHAPDIMSLLLLQNSANLLKLKGSQNASDALTFYTSFAGSTNNVWDASLDNSLLAFERGKLAMYFGYSYDIFAIQAANPALHFSIHPVPHLPGKNITIASYWDNAVSSQSKHPKEAIEFMQFLAQKDTQQKLYTEEAKSRAFGELYARTDLAQSLAGSPLLAPFVSQFPGAQSSFFVADTGFTDYNDALNQYLGNAITSVLNNVSVDTAAATLADGVSQITSQYATKP